MAAGSVFIGRAAELGRLDAALDRAGHGQPQVLLLAGEAGVGKTRLLAAFADRARGRGVRVLAGGCVELATSASPTSRWSTPCAGWPTTRRRPGCWPGPPSPPRPRPAAPRDRAGRAAGRAPR
jgi:hypothetical protein